LSTVKVYKKVKGISYIKNHSVSHKRIEYIWKNKMICKFDKMNAL